MSHPVCGARWGGFKTSHCLACHFTFSTVANFDRHQRNGECIDPSEVGLVLAPRAGYWVWQQPGDPEATAAAIARVSGGAP